AALLTRMSSLPNSRSARSTSDLQCASSANRAPAGLLHPARRLLRVLMFLEIRDQHVGAFAREGDGDGASGEPAAAFVGVLAVVRRRRHFVRLAWRGLLLWLLWRVGMRDLGVLRHW